MSRSVNQCIPQLVEQLIAKHAAAWSKTSRGSVSFQRRRGLGYFIVIRTPALGARRLVSARVLTTSPSTRAEWKLIRQQMLERGNDKIADAKHRYLIVPEEVVAEARKEMAKTKVTVLPNQISHRTVDPRRVNVR